MNLTWIIKKGEIDGYIILPWNTSKLSTELRSKWYDNREKANKPMIAIHEKDDGSGEIEYDFITTDRKVNLTVDYISLMRELDYELYNPKMKTKQTKVTFTSPGAVWGEYLFIKEDRNKVISTVIKYIKHARSGEYVSH